MFRCTIRSCMEVQFIGQLFPSVQAGVQIKQFQQINDRCLPIAAAALRQAIFDRTASTSTGSALAVGAAWALAPGGAEASVGAVAVEEDEPAAGSAEWKILDIIELNMLMENHPGRDWGIDNVPDHSLVPTRRINLSKDLAYSRCIFYLEFT